MDSQKFLWVSSVKHWGQQPLQRGFCSYFFPNLVHSLAHVTGEVDSNNWKLTFEHRVLDSPLRLSELGRGFFTLGHGPGAWVKDRHVLTVYDRTERTAHTCFCCELCLFHSIHSPAFSTHSWVNLPRSNAESTQQTACSASSGVKQRWKFKGQSWHSRTCCLRESE